MTGIPVIPAARLAGGTLPGEPHEVRRPEDGGLLCRVGWADEADVDRVVRAAADARGGWADTSAADRAAASRAIAQGLRDRVDELADAIAAESGKRLPEARAEVEFSARYFDWFADAAVRGAEEQTLDSGGRRFRVREHPLGVVAAVGTWNFPLSIPARKVAAALAAGCPVVLKPSERTPLSADLLVGICESRLPTGVIGSVNGDGEALVTALIDHPLVAGITYTGSTSVGRTVARRCAATLTRAVLELGGRAPFIIRADADVSAAVDTLLIAKLRNNGESCIAANNVLVHADIADDVVRELADRLPALRPAAPGDPDGQLGPLIDDVAVRRLAGLVAEAERAGAEVHRGPDGPAEGSYHPVVLVRGPGDDLLWDEEVFGPVIVLRAYDDEDALVREVNAWGTGLAGYVCGTDVDAAEELAGRLRIGIVGVNTGTPNTPEVPFGGFGDSGVGREGGMSGYREFVEEQTLATAAP